MFRDVEAQRRQVVHLAAFAQHHRRVLQRRLKVRAAARAMFDLVVWRRHQPQRLTPMSQLPTRLLATALPQALGLPLESVARRRLAAVVAVLGQPCFQLLHARHQCRHLRALGCILGFELANAFLRHHAPMLRLARKPA
jgi:hypothetical protein